MIKDSFGYRKKRHYFSYRKACDEAYLKKYLKMLLFLKIYQPQHLLNIFVLLAKN